MLKNVQKNIFVNLDQKHMARSLVPLSSNNHDNLFKCNCFQYELSYFPLSICCETHHDLFRVRSTKYIANELQNIFNNEVMNIMQRYDYEMYTRELPELSKRLLFNGMTLSEICVLLVRYELKRNEWEMRKTVPLIQNNNNNNDDNEMNVFKKSYNNITKYVYTSLTSIVDDVLNLPENQTNTAQDKNFKADFIRLLKEEHKYSRQFKNHKFGVKSKHYKYKSKRKRHDVFFSSVWILPIDEYIRQCAVLSNQDSELCPPYKRQLIYQKCDSFMKKFHNDFITYNVNRKSL